MSWGQALIRSFVWVAGAGVLSIALAILLRRGPTSKIPRPALKRLETVILLLPFALPFVAQPAFGEGARRFQDRDFLGGFRVWKNMWSWPVFITTLLLQIPTTLVAYGVMGTPLSLKDMEGQVESKWKSSGLPSLSVAVVAPDGSVWTKAFGVVDRRTGRAATPETPYQIGSISKVFTTTVLAALRDKGVVRLDDPVSIHLPAQLHLPSDPRGDPMITLRHLATHTSGLPRIPVNLKAKGTDPYGGYSVEDLYAGLAKSRLDSPTGSEESYSNLGVGLLGHVLEKAAGESYESLVKRYILEPLGMSQTLVTLSDEARAARARGYKGDDANKEADEWDLGCLAPAGAIVSTAPDLAKFVALQLKAGQAGVTPVAGPTLREMHTIQRLSKDWKHGIGLGWVIVPDPELGDVVWHNGGTDGFTSYIGFSPSKRVGVVVLTNSGKGVDEIGLWLLHKAAEAFPYEEKQEVDPALHEIAKQLGEHFQAEQKATVADLFHTDFLAAIPVEKIQEICKGVHKSHGSVKSLDIKPGKNPKRGLVTYTHQDGSTSKLEMEVDSGNPPKIIYALFK